MLLMSSKALLVAEPVWGLWELEEPLEVALVAAETRGGELSGLDEVVGEGSLLVETLPGFW